MHQFLKSNSTYFSKIVLDIVYCFDLALPECMPGKSVLKNTFHGKEQDAETRTARVQLIGRRVLKRVCAQVVWGSGAATHKTPR